MSNFFKDIFEYNFEFNQRLLTEIVQHQAQLPSRSFPLFCHILNAHQIWNARLLKEAEFGVQQQHKLSDCFLINQQNHENSLKIIAESNLEASISYQNTAADSFTNKIADILFHIINHSTHHRGQIVADFRSSNIPPIVTDYIFFKR